jgi:thioredoxin 1
MKPDLDELEKEYGERLRVVRVDVNEHKEFAERFSVVSTPTIVMFSGGKPALRVLGYATRLDLKQKIEELLKNAD